ncbi:MAG: hypothetical protein Q7S50_00160 [bacterium]|nr:hypothetical protein [bacterium]
MVYDYHVVLGAIGAGLVFVGDTLYIWSIIKGSTKPHIFTWFIYVLIDGTVFAVQLLEGGGAGSWVLGTATVANSIIMILALFKGEKNIRPIDWACLVGAGFGIILWQVIENPFGAVVILTVVNTIALIPTFRKAFVRPAEESISVWLVDVIRFSLSIAALEVRTLTTALFPVGVVLVNSLLVGIILLRRRQLGRIS